MHEAVEAFPISQRLLSEISGKLSSLKDNVKRVIRGKDEVIEMALVALCARGHLLIEDIPGVGKTSLARALARSIDCTFRRIQFTSDLLPSDVIGVSIYDSTASEFQFKPGPIFANIVLADEINRGTPKTQSALLEAMNERQVTYDNKTYPLPSPFLVIATQNPFDHHGTFPLPESQMDRFFMRIRIGYPPDQEERAIMRSEDSFYLVEELESVLCAEDMRRIQEEVSKVAVDDALVDYMLRIIKASRDLRVSRLGASPRAAQVLYRASQARALLAGRNHCLPDDPKRVAVSVLGHRIIPAGSHAGSGTVETEAIIEEILDSTDVPL